MRKPRPALSRAQVTFRAGLSRLVLGAAALVLLPLGYPATRAHVWLLGAYLAVAALEQVLIRKELGGRGRALTAGLLDLAVITYFVHRLGSSATALPALYFFAGALNALVVGFRVGMALAVLQAIAYDAVVWAEHAGRLAFAPDAPDLAALGPPSFERAVTASTVVTTLLLASTALVGVLAHAVRAREAELTEANRKLEELTQRDPLTGLFNRRHLFARLEVELARVRRGRASTVLMFDLDHFKQVNDRHGHPRGDALLRDVATALNATTRLVDVAARYGGDEFVLILPDTELADARGVADRVAAAVREVGLRVDAERPVTASIGVAVAREEDSVESVIKRADEAAYRAKQAGGDRVECG